jgi:hypothetical protein
MKYGAFGVYTNDAKRVFNHVTVDNVYTHRCAKEMAIGILKNSNATLAISVTGNAMPLNHDIHMLGEVFICIAGYSVDNQIIFETKSINACMESDDRYFKETCANWYKVIADDSKKYNPRLQTAINSQLIRQYVTKSALDYCLEFVNKYNPVVPEFVLTRIQQNNAIVDEIHIDIPANKFVVDLEEVCVNKCSDTLTTERVDTKEYKYTGGKRTLRTRKKRRNIH